MRDLIYDVINYCTASSCGLGVKKTSDYLH